MNTIELWSRSTDKKILTGLGRVTALGLAWVIAYVYPVPRGFEAVPVVDALISVAILAFLWAGFRVVRPIRPNQTWEAVEFAGIALMWMLLFALFLLWLPTNLNFGSCDYDPNAIAPLLL